MPRPRLLAVDIDGTLVNSRDELTPRTQEALQHARRHGIEVVLATGRRYSRTLPLVERLGLDVPLVTASGALIKHPRDHRTLFQAHFERQLLCALLSAVASHGYDAVLYTDSYCQGFDFYCPSLTVDDEELADYLARNPGCGREWPQLMTNPPDGVFAGFVTGTREEMVALERALASQFGEQLSLHVLRSPRYLGFMCELAPQGVTKWSGISRLARQWGISPDEICAVGDDVNDIPMIREAGLGIAMGNALDVVKQAADRIAPSHDEDGLAQIVEWLTQ